MSGPEKVFSEELAREAAMQAILGAREAVVLVIREMARKIRDEGTDITAPEALDMVADAVEKLRP